MIENVYREKEKVNWIKYDISLLGKGSKPDDIREGRTFWWTQTTIVLGQKLSLHGVLTLEQIWWDSHVSWILRKIENPRYDDEIQTDAQKLVSKIENPKRIIQTSLFETVLVNECLHMVKVVVCFPYNYHLQEFTEDDIPN